MTLACDICRCKAGNCDVRESCQRFTDAGEGCYRISWSDFSAALVKDANSGCEWMIPIKQEFAYYESFSQATAQAVEDIKLMKVKLKAKRA